MTEKDKELIEKANKLNFIDWSYVEKWSKEADTEEAREILHSISNRLYHTEEYFSNVQ